MPHLASLSFLGELGNVSLRLPPRPAWGAVPHCNVTDNPNLSDGARSRFEGRRIAPAGGASREAGDAPERHGDPAAEYEHATAGCAMVRRADRGLLRIWGRAPRQMLNGMLTNRLPEPPDALGDAGGSRQGRDRLAEAETDRGESLPAWAAALAGERTYGTILTRKGRIVSDVRTFWLGGSEDAGLGLDLAAAAWDRVLRHFATYLPPRMAKTEDLSGETGLLTVVGDRARSTLQGVFGGVPEDGGYWLVGGGPGEGGAVVARGLEQAPSWDVWAGRSEMDRIAGRLGKAGAVLVGSRTWETLRVEAGYPAMGADMDESVIPIEAGLERRAFDHDKGCYTGQEVVVRLLHRGRVNWRLRALRFADADAAPGDALYAKAAGKAVGRVTSCVRSPRFGQRIGMGYVRREVEPPAVLRLGSAEGPEVAVLPLPPELDGAGGF